MLLLRSFSCFASPRHRKAPVGLAAAALMQGSALLVFLLSGCGVSTITESPSVVQSDISQADATAHVYDPTAYTEIKWKNLLPKNWDPMKKLKMPDLAALEDSDPRAAVLLGQMKAIWDEAPAENSISERKIRIPGFVIPLDMSGEAVKTFLLVPYFGACIHTPPPPANQMVVVTLAAPHKKLRTMDAVWVNGTMHLVRGDSPWGRVAYQLQADHVADYSYSR